MRFYPSSYGTGRSAIVKRTREFNPCHDPKSGMFAPKGQGECDEGEWTDKGRTRAIYGQEADPKGALDLDSDETAAADDWLNPSEDSADRREAKKTIAQTLGDGLEDHEGFEEFYREFRHTLPDVNEGGSDGWETGDYPWDDDPLDLKSAYKSEYEDYKNEKIEGL